MPQLWPGPPDVIWVLEPVGDPSPPFAFGRYRSYFLPEIDATRSDSSSGADHPAACSPADGGHTMRTLCELEDRVRLPTRPEGASPTSRPLDRSARSGTVTSVPRVTLSQSHSKRSASHCRRATEPCRRLIDRSSLQPDRNRSVGDGVGRSRMPAMAFGPKTSNSSASRGRPPIPTGGEASSGDSQIDDRREALRSRSAVFWPKVAAASPRSIVRLGRWPRTVCMTASGG